MAMRAKFSAESILDAAAVLVLERGAQQAPAVTDIARALGAPSGSIYYRFGSHRELITELWLRSVRRFHQQYLTAAVTGHDSPAEAQDALIAMARTVVEHVRAQPANAACMKLFSQKRLLDFAPEALLSQVTDVNKSVHARLSELCLRRYGVADEERLDFVRTAAIALPYGLVRPYVGFDVPQRLNDIVTAGALAVLRLGDENPGEPGSASQQAS